MELIFYVIITIALVIIASLGFYWVFEIITKVIESHKKKKRSAEAEIVFRIAKERIKHEIWSKALKIVVQEYYDKNGMKAIEPTFEMLEESFWLKVRELVDEQKHETPYLIKKEVSIECKKRKNI